MEWFFDKEIYTLIKYKITQLKILLFDTKILSFYDSWFFNHKIPISLSGKIENVRFLGLSPHIVFVQMIYLSLHQVVILADYFRRWLIVVFLVFLKVKIADLITIKILALHKIWIRNWLFSCSSSSTTFGAKIDLKCGLQ